MSEVKRYDYIIAGSGLAGLSLLHRLLLDDSLKHKKILVLDSVRKTENDRTWCFWETGESIFESVVMKKWNTLRFASNTVDKTFDLKHYAYKMIRGIDFYEYVLEYAAQFPNITFQQETIVNIHEREDRAAIETDAGVYEADYIFNSTGIFNPEMSTEDTLLQHFMGWNIKSPQASFDTSTATLMDFRLDQKHGTTFMYVLPTSENQALVEYTLFTPEILDKEAYKRELESYIYNELQLDDFEIEHEEFGVIPMSLAKFQRQMGERIINLGTAGGYTKASTGYTFQFVQRQVEGIVSLLNQGRAPRISFGFRDKMFEWYDRTLLDVLLTEKMTGEEIFTSLFKKTDPELILAFLDNKSGFWEEFIIRNSVPLFPFMTSGIKQLMKA